MGGAHLTELTADAPFPRQALRAPVGEAARALLGALVVTRVHGARVAVRLTEVEAYAGEADPASHAFRGPTPRTAVMYAAPGLLYVYFTYGMHWCANVVCGPEGTASAVLLRAGEVVEGLDAARTRRVACRTDRDLARGPARLCAALGIDGALSGTDTYAPVSPVLLLAGDPVADHEVSRGPRVGVRGGAETPWRFWRTGDVTVSAYKPHADSRRGRRQSSP